MAAIMKDRLEKRAEQERRRSLSSRPSLSNPRSARSRRKNVEVSQPKKTKPKIK